MNFRFITLLTLLRFLLAHPVVSVAQLSNDKRLTQFVLRNYTTEQGLQSNTVLRLGQAKDGFIWIGTYEGLSRFDGKEFKNFNLKTLPGLKSNSISDIISISAQEMVFATRGGGAYLLKNQKARLLHPHLAEKFVTCLLRSSNKEIWIATERQGLYVLNGSDLKQVYQKEFDHIRITRLLEISPGEVWVATDTRGITIIKDGKVTGTIDHSSGLSDDFVINLNRYRQQVYVSTQRGLSVIDLPKRSIHEVPALAGIVTNVAVIDSLHNLWVGSSNGLFRITKDNKVEIFNEANGLSNEEVWDILFDNEGNVWFCTYRGGLYQLSDGKFINYNSSDGFSSSGVRTVFELKNGSRLIGFENGDFYSVNKRDISKSDLLKPMGFAIYDIKEDKEGNMWVASYNGLFERKADGSEKHFNLANGFPSNILRCILIDSDNQVWVGSRDKGIVLMKDDKIVDKYSADNVLGSNLIMSMEENQNGDIYIATNSAGFYIYKKNTKTFLNYSVQTGLPSNVVFNVRVDKDDQEKIWVTTDKGLVLISHGKLLTFKNAPVISDHSLFDILEDKLGFFWMPTSTGVVQVKKQELLHHLSDTTQTIQLKIFAAQDGIKFPQCMGAAQSLIATNGEIWIPMAKGLISFDPTNLRQNKVAPPVYISSVEIDNQKLDTAFNDIKIEPGLKYMSIKYGAISYTFSEGVKFQVKLEPYDNHWIDMNEKREAVYTNLEGGKYNFSVRACNNDGVWNEAGASFQFTIAHHFYETYLFYFCTILVAFLGIVFTIKGRTYQIARRNKLLQTLVENKTAQLQKNLDDLKRAQVQLVQSEKMASLGVLTAGIAHEINNPVNFISVGIAALDRKLAQLKKGLTEVIPDEKLGKEILQTQEKIDQLIKDIKIGTTRTEEIVSSLRTFSHLDKAELKLSDINEGIESTLVLLNSKFKDRIEIIKHLEENLPRIICNPGQLNQVFMNILTNSADAIKGRGTVTISTESTPEHLVITITDTGIGMSKTVQEKIFEPFFTTKDIGHGTGLGLSISYGIIQQHKGSITVNSGEGKGTEFVIRVPRNLKFKDIVSNLDLSNGTGT